MVFIAQKRPRDVRRPEEQQEQQQQEQEEKKVWRPPATAESSRTASLARHVHEAETEIDFPVGVPKGLTPQPPTWVPKLGGRKCRNLHGSLSLVAESVVFYMGP